MALDAKVLRNRAYDAKYRASAKGKATAARYHETHRKAKAKRVAEWSRKNKDKTRAAALRYRARHPARVAALTHARYVKSKYGIDAAAYKMLTLAQEGRCAICLRSEPVIYKNWCVDHDHITGKVRGLLCSYCNSALGLMGDASETLRRAADYLDRVKVL